MKKILYIICIIAFSCTTSGKAGKVIYNGISLERNLLMLDEFRTSFDTCRNGSIVKYDALNLKKNRNGNLLELYLKDQVILIANIEKYEFLFEVLDSSFLIITYIEGKSYAFGPDVFRRNNVLILDLKSSILKKVSLEKVFITRSKDYLMRYSSESDDMHSIDCIDINNSKLLLLDRRLNLKEYILMDAEKPFKCN
jgi:hypothetical protein